MNQEPRWVRLVEKISGQKSRATVPLSRTNNIEALLHICTLFDIQKTRRKICGNNFRKRQNYCPMKNKMPNFTKPKLGYF